MTLTLTQTALMATALLTAEEIAAKQGTSVKSVLRAQLRNPALTADQRTALEAALIIAILPGGPERKMDLRLERR